MRNQKCKSLLRRNHSSRRSVNDSEGIRGNEMVRMTQRDALNTALERTPIPVLDFGDDPKPMVEQYTVESITLALQLLKFPEKESRFYAKCMKGCPRIRFFKAINKLEKQ